MQVGVVGYTSHRFNLAVQDILKQHDALLTKERNTMKKLRFPLAAAKLRKITHLRAKFDNVTRWSSAVQMLDRYLKLKDYIEQLEIDELDELALTTREVRQIEKVCTKLQQLD